MRAPGWFLSLLYVSAVAALAVITFADPDRTLTWMPEGLLLLATLPALIPGLPLVYVGGAAIWNLNDPGQGAPMWPIAASYGLIFTVIAIANVWLVRTALTRRGHRRASARAAIPDGRGPLG